jgi:hypothetical protein
MHQPQDAAMRRVEEHHSSLSRGISEEALPSYLRASATIPITGPRAQHN